MEHLFLMFLDHTHDAPQSVGLLWTSDQLVAETSTQISMTRWDSNPRSQQVSGRRLLMSYIYGALILDVSRSHTRRTTVGRTPLDE